MAASVPAMRRHVAAAKGFRWALSTGQRSTCTRLSTTALLAGLCDLVAPRGQFHEPVEQRHLSGMRLANH